MLASIHEEILKKGKRSICHLRINNSYQATGTLICVDIKNNLVLHRPLYSLVTANHALPKRAVDNLEENKVDIEFMHEQKCNFRLKNTDIGKVRVYRSQEDIDITHLELSHQRQRELIKLDAYFLDISTASLNTKVILLGFPGEFPPNMAHLFNTIGLISAVLDDYRLKTSATGPPGYSGGVLIAEDLGAVSIHCRYAPNDPNHNIGFNLSHLARLILEDFRNENLNPVDRITSSVSSFISSNNNIEQIEHNPTEPSSMLVPSAIPLTMPSTTTSGVHIVVKLIVYVDSETTVRRETNFIIMYLCTIYGFICIFIQSY